MVSLQAGDKQEKHTKSYFFQAEDGIRDVAVTGVQTCALPISYFKCCIVNVELRKPSPFIIHNSTFTIHHCLCYEHRSTRPARPTDPGTREVARHRAKDGPTPRLPYS